MLFVNARKNITSKMAQVAQISPVSTETRTNLVINVVVERKAVLFLFRKYIVLTAIRISQRAVLTNQI